VGVLAERAGDAVGADDDHRSGRNRIPSGALGPQRVPAARRQQPRLASTAVQVTAAEHLDGGALGLRADDRGHHRRGALAAVKRLCRSIQCPVGGQLQYPVHGSPGRIGRIPDEAAAVRDGEVQRRVAAVPGGTDRVASLRP
jgi:hypothetical protein